MPRHILPANVTCRHIDVVIVDAVPSRWLCVPFTPTPHADARRTA